MKTSLSLDLTSCDTHLDIKSGGTKLSKYGFVTHYLVDRVDPKKMIETGTFRINNKGEQSKILVSHRHFSVMHI